MLFAIFQQCHCTLVMNSDNFRSERKLYYQKTVFCLLLVCSKHGPDAALALGLQGHCALVLVNTEKHLLVSKASVTYSDVGAGSTCAAASTTHKQVQLALQAV